LGLGAAEATPVLLRYVVPTTVGSHIEEQRRAGPIGSEVV